MGAAVASCKIPPASAVSNAGLRLLQVRLYFPETASPAFGVMRAIVKDMTDMDDGNSSQTWLDSNGQVSAQTFCQSHLGSVTICMYLMHLMQAHYGASNATIMRVKVPMLWVPMLLQHACA